MSIQHSGHVSPDVDAIKHALQDWSDAINTRRPDSLSNLVSDDVVFIHPPALPLAGKDAVAGFYRAAFQVYDVGDELQYEEIRVIGGALATARVTEHIQLKPKNGGAVVDITAAQAMRFRRQRDGAWKLVSRSLSAPSKLLMPFVKLAQGSSTHAGATALRSPSSGSPELPRDVRSEKVLHESAQATLALGNPVYRKFAHGWTTP